MSLDLDAFSRNPEAVAVVARGGDFFSLLRRRVVLPPTCGALVWNEGGATRLIGVGGTVDDDGTREVLVVRVVPFELRYEATGLTSQDGHPFTATLDISVQTVPERSELASLRRALLGSRGRADLNRLRQYCEEIVRLALADFVRERPAAELVVPGTWGAFDAMFVERFKPLGFESGLALGPDPRLTLASPAFAEARRREDVETQRRKRADAEQQLRTAAMQAKKAHLAELEGLVGKVRQLSEQSPGTALADVIRTFDPQRRGELYHGLLSTAAQTRQTEAIVVVAGDECLWFAPASPARPTRRMALTSPLGGLRSVRVQMHDGKRVILVGAGRGLHWIDGDARPSRTFEWTQTGPIRGGFNAAAIAGGRVWASHSEIGIVAWSLDAATPPFRVFSHLTSRARAVRDLQCDEIGRLWCVIDNRIISWSPDEIVGISGAGPHEQRDPASSPAPDGAYASVHGAAHRAPRVTPQSGEVLLSIDAAAGPATPAFDLDLGAAENAPPGADKPRAEFVAPDVIATLLVAEDRVFAGLRDGRVIAWPTDDTEGLEVVRPRSGESVEGLAWLTGGGIPRLLVADGSDQLDLLVLGDAYRGEYRANQPMRWAFAAEDVIVGVNNNRDTMFFWAPQTPETVSAVVGVGRLTGRSIQDVALVPVAAGESG